MLEPRSSLDLTATFIGLTNGTLYTFSVTASNAVGSSSPSQVTSTPGVEIVPIAWDPVPEGYGTGMMYNNSMVGTLSVFFGVTNFTYQIWQELGVEYGAGLRRTPIVPGGYVTGQSNLGPLTRNGNFYYCVWIAPVNNMTVKKYLIRETIVETYTGGSTFIIDHSCNSIPSEIGGSTRYAFIIDALLYYGYETITITAADVNGVAIGNPIFSQFNIPQPWIF
jgi:hypothetical protein